MEISLTGAMIVSGVVLVITFLAIFAEQLRHIERSKVAAAGAGTMIVTGQVFGFYSLAAPLEAVDWNVIFLLAAMMTIVSIMIPTNGFNCIWKGVHSAKCTLEHVEAHWCGTKVGHARRAMLFIAGRFYFGDLTGGSIVAGRR